MRVVVKNLPPTVTEEAIRKHFSQVAAPTDVRLLTDLARRSRRVAFIGYKTAADGLESIRYYHKSYFNQHKLVVEELRPGAGESPPQRRAKSSAEAPVGVAEMKEIVKLLSQKRTTWENAVEAEEAPAEPAAKKSVAEVIRAYQEQRDQEHKKKVQETGEIFVRGIPYAATEEEIEAEFAKYGPVAEVYLKHKERADAWGEGQSLNYGYALVTYTFPQDAYRVLGKTIVFQGRNVTLHPSTGRAHEEPSSKNRTNVSHGKYNALFFNFSAILGIAAKEKKVSKALLLTDRGTGLGGKMALLESELIEKTKIFIRNEKISEECTCAKLPCRCMFTSKKTILVKNLPYNTQEAEIKQFFKKYVRLVFAPSKTLAILEYANRSDALQELKKNNFSKIRDHPIYAEYLKVTKERYYAELGSSQADSFLAQLAPPEPAPSLPSPTDLAAAAPARSKLILKNVPFQAGRSELSEMLDGIIGQGYRLRMPKKFDGSHRGFCFVELDQQELAATLVARLKHIHLYGRRVIAEYANL